MTLDIHELMQELSERRPVFHSREDFRRTLASYIGEVTPDCHIQLEFPIPVPGKNPYLDIWLDTVRVGIKLIFTTRALDLYRGDERFLLREHGGQPSRRYDFLKDVQRVEQAIFYGQAKEGYTIFLTNRPDYWNPPSREDVIDAAFRLHEGREVTGRLVWSERAAPKTIEGKEAPIDIFGSYNLHWQDYSRLGWGNNQQFRYLAVAVQ